MYGHMRLDCTVEGEHQSWSRLHILYYSGDLFIVPNLSRVNNLTISVSKVLSIGECVREC